MVEVALVIEGSSGEPSPSFILPITQLPLKVGQPSPAIPLIIPELSLINWPPVIVILNTIPISFVVPE